MKIHAREEGPGFTAPQWSLEFGKTWHMVLSTQKEEKRVDNRRSNDIMGYIHLKDSFITDSYGFSVTFPVGRSVPVFAFT
jgi:hypothetical protein